MTNADADAAQARKSNDGAAPRRTLVVFADGTGNAFASRQTNVWRLYGALDKTEIDQVARYIPGVGTSGFRLVRMLDAAFGFGVPSNVRKLYRFLCWNWNPGDRIYLFGFSRGAFTVRTLAGMVGWQGLMPRKIGERPVGTAEMRRNVAAAWRAYRKVTTTTPRSPGPTVRLGRSIRDACVWLKRWALGEMQHSEVAARVAGTKRGPFVTGPGPEDRAADGVRIDFVGLFDTVEAYGLPVEELRRPFGWLVFPLSFANHKCSPCVRMARHALAIDEERLTFAQVGFKRPEAGSGQSIEERWFAGVHADIGGGYPDDHGSIEPLQWIAEEAADCGGPGRGLRFRPGALDALQAQGFGAAPIHDSRSGFAAVYRYQPRSLPDGACLADRTIDKIRDGVDGYAPVALHEGVRPVNGAPMPAMREGYGGAIKEFVARRRFASRALVVVALALGASRWLVRDAPDHLGIEIPFLGWVKPWLNALWDLGIVGAALVLAAAALWYANGALRDRTRDLAVEGWSGPAPAGAEPPRFPRRLAARAPRRLPEALLIGGGVAVALLVGSAQWDGLRSAVATGGPVAAEAAPEAAPRP